jgi:carboxypeptidase PM20D1
VKLDRRAVGQRLSGRLMMAAGLSAGLLLAACTPAPATAGADAADASANAPIIAGTAASEAAADIIAASRLSPPEFTAKAIDLLAASVSHDTVAGRGRMKAYADFLAGTLIAGGFAPADVRVTEMDGTATLVATYRGSGARKPILLSAHMDVVEAMEKDWERPPFTPVVENGYMYGRGVTDNKFDLVMMVVTLIRLKSEGFAPDRDIILALSGDEETEMATTAKLADEFAGIDMVLNGDGGGGTLAEDGAPVGYFLQAAEKTYADFKVTLTNPGGHSSLPRADNAIYQLADAIRQVERHRFPFQANDITRAYFRQLAAQHDGALGAAMLRFAANPADKAAGALLATYPEHVGQIGTTCVATMLAGGHALNALPQSASVDINCRIFPGTEPEEVRTTLEKVIGNPEAKIVRLEQTMASDASPLRDDVLAALRKAVDRRYPDLPIIPSMSAGATDSLYFRAKGIPSYGVAGIFMKSSDEFSHGLNERSPLASVDGALDHWRVLLTELAG